MDPLIGLIDLILASQTVTALVEARVFKGSAAQIGEAAYPNVTIERRTIGDLEMNAPAGDFDILVTSRATTMDGAWTLHDAVKTAIGRARWTLGSQYCTALASSTPFDLPEEADAQPVYPVAQIFQIHTFG